MEATPTLTSPHIGLYPPNYPKELQLRVDTDRRLLFHAIRQAPYSLNVAGFYTQIKHSDPLFQKKTTYDLSRRFRWIITNLEAGTLRELWPGLSPKQSSHLAKLARCAQRRFYNEVIGLPSSHLTAEDLGFDSSEWKALFGGLPYTPARSIFPKATPADKRGGRSRRLRQNLGCLGSEPQKKKQRASRPDAPQQEGPKIRPSFVLDQKIVANMEAALNEGPWIDQSALWSRIAMACDISPKDAEMRWFTLLRHAYLGENAPTGWMGQPDYQQGKLREQIMRIANNLKKHD